MADGEKNPKKSDVNDHSDERSVQSRHRRRFKDVKSYQRRERGTDNRGVNRTSRVRFSTSRSSASNNGRSRRKQVRNEKDHQSFKARPRHRNSVSSRRRSDGRDFRQRQVQPPLMPSEPRASPKHNRDLPKTPEEIVERMGRTKKRILIELYKDSVGYKKLSKILGVGLDTIRSHIKSGKYSTSLQEIGLVERSDSGGWQLTALGLQVCELLQQDPELRAYFY